MPLRRPIGTRTRLSEDTWLGMPPLNVDRDIVPQ